MPAPHSNPIGLVMSDSCTCSYLPMIVQLPFVMLACARIGAVHSVVFGGFSAEALSDRMVAAPSSLPSTLAAVSAHSI